MKYVLATSSEMGEENIAVIQLIGDTIPVDKLQIALDEHFDAEVQINSIEEISKFPLHYIAKCSFTANENELDPEQEGADAEVHMFNVDLVETWVY